MKRYKNKKRFQPEDLHFLDYPQKEFNRYSYHSLMILWDCISKKDRKLVLKLSSSHVSILSEEIEISSSKIDKSLTGAIFDCLWKYYYKYYLKIKIHEG